MGNKIFLVLGGARSGKSEFAEKLMYHFTGKRKGYIATSQILDEEMKYRVLLHKERRPSDWKTYEIMHTAGNQIGTVLNETDTILFDCITMYVSNLLMDHISNIDAEVLGVSDLEKLQSLLQNDLDRMFNEISLVSDREIIFVSDELGMGIVPANAMGRVYRDLVGLANQYIAKKADEVYLSIAGITVAEIVPYTPSFVAMYPTAFFSPVSLSTASPTANPVTLITLSFIVCNLILPFS